MPFEADCGFRSRLKKEYASKKLIIVAAKRLDGKKKCNFDIKPEFML